MPRNKEALASARSKRSAPSSQGKAFKFRPSRSDRLNKGQAERRIGGGIARVEVDRTLEHLLRLVVAFACRVREDLAAAQDVFVSDEAVCGLAEGALPLEAGELHRRRANNAPINVFLHAKDVIDLTVVGLGPDVSPGCGLAQLGSDPYTLRGAANAAFQKITRSESARDLGGR